MVYTSKPWLKGSTWPRQVLGDVLTGVARALDGRVHVSTAHLWQVQVDGVVQASGTLQVALAARLCGSSWHGIALALNRHHLQRLVNHQAGDDEGRWAPWTPDDVRHDVLRVPREPALAHVLGWFAAEFTGGDLLEAVWMISAMDNRAQMSTRSFLDQQAGRAARAGIERALAVARAAAADEPTGANESLHAPLRRDFRAAAADVARSCWYWLWGPGARGRLGIQRTMQDAFLPVAAQALDAAGMAAVDEAVRGRTAEAEAEERERRRKMVQDALAVDRGKKAR